MTELLFLQMESGGFGESSGSSCAWLKENGSYSLRNRSISAGILFVMFPDTQTVRDCQWQLVCGACCRGLAQCVSLLVTSTQQHGKKCSRLKNMEVCISCCSITSMPYCLSRPGGCCAVSWAHVPSSTWGPTLCPSLCTPNHAPESRPRGTRLGPRGGLHPALSHHDTPRERWASTAGATKCESIQKSNQKSSQHQFDLSPAVCLETLTENHELWSQHFPLPASLCIFSIHRMAVTVIPLRLWSAPPRCMKGISSLPLKDEALN